MSDPSSFRRLPLRLVVAGGAALLGCGEDVTAAAPNETPPGGAPAERSPSGGGLYAVTTQLYSPDQDLAYVELVSDIDDIGSALTTTLEIPGYGLAVGPSLAGTLYVASDQAATVTRYSVTNAATTADARFEQTGVVSFAAQGVGVIYGYSGQFQFISPTKAYFLESETLQAIVWDPTAMTVTGAVDLSALSLPGFSVALDGEPTRRADELVVVAGYYDLEAAVVARETRVAFLDSTTDAVQIATDARCGYITHSILAPNGDIYLASDTWAVAVYQASGDNVRDSCVLRIKAGEHEIDPTYRADLAAQTGSVMAGSLLPGQGNTAFVRGFDPALFQGDMRSYDELWSAGAWRWYSIELGVDAPATLVDTLDVGAPSSLQLPFEGRTFSNSSEADYRSSRLLDMEAEGGPEDVGAVPGIPVGVVHLY